MARQTKKTQPGRVQVFFFSDTVVDIDDLMLINNDGQMKKVMADIYPKELVLVPEDSDDQSCSFLDLQVVIKDSVITTSIFDKRDAFDFPIINFPTLTGNIPNRSSYGVFIGELVRYSRGCTYYKDFEDRATVLVTKLLRQASEGCLFVSS